MTLFLSQYINKLDKKDRVSIPSSYRNFLTQNNFHGAVLFFSPNYPCLEGFNWFTIEDIARRIDEMSWFSGDQDDMATTLFGGSHPVNMDGEGRIGLTKELKDFAGLDESVLFVGLGRKFQMWDPARFEERQKQARKNVREKSLTLPPKPSGKDGQEDQ